MLVVGITFFLSNKRTIWNNGGDQHCVFLRQLLSTLSDVEVLAINGGDGEKAPAGMLLDGLGINFHRLPDVIDRLDMLVEMGAQVSAEDVERVHAHGGKVVAFRYGNSFVIDAERMIHGKPAGSIFNGARFDEVWTNPQHERTCRSWWEVNHRCPVRVLPHIWSPVFVQRAVREFKSDLVFGYRPNARRGRVVVAEPDINIVKTCMVPLLACEVVERRRPDVLGDVYVLNSEHLKKHLTFEQFASHLDVVRAESRNSPGTRKCSFEARYRLPWFMSAYGDVLLSHQWENALNYAWYDAMYGGWPVVHNSDMLPVDVGFRYSGFDAQDAARALEAALIESRESAAERQRREHLFLLGLLPTAAGPREAHARALHDVLGRSLLSS